MTSRTEKLLLVLLFVLAFWIRFAYHFDELAAPPSHPDGYYYHRLAENVLRGRGYSFIWSTGHEYRLFRPPGYPLFLAALYSIFGFNFAAVRCVEMGVSAASVLLLFFTCFRLFGRKAAWAAGGLAVFYWRAVLWSAMFRAETLFMFFVLLALYLLVADARRGAPAPVFLSGLMLAFSCLVRPNIIGVAPALALWIVAACRGSPIRRVGASALFTAAFLLGVSPWIIYNWSRGIGPADAMGTTMGAVNIWMAHNPAVGDEVDNRGFEEINRLRFRNYTLDEHAWGALLRKESGQFVRSDPLRALRMALLRFRKHWLAAGVMDGEGTIYPDRGRNRYGVIYFYEGFWKPGTYFRDNLEVTMEFKKRLTVAGVWIPLMTFEGVFDLCVAGTLAGLILARGRPMRILSPLWRRASLLVVFAAGYALFSIVGHAHHRLRFPVEWVALAFAGLGVGAIIELVPRLRTPKPSPESYPQPRCGLLYAAVPALALCFTLAIRGAIAGNREGLSRICAAPSQEPAAAAFFAKTRPQIAARLSPGLSYREVWRSLMEHGGDLGRYRGNVVCWTGEATFLRAMPLAELRYENPPYREAWERAAPGDREPFFIRMVIGSYANPAALGEGEVLVICDRRTAAGIRDGDHVSVLAELSGCDAAAMGYPILFGHGVYRWEDEKKSQIPIIFKTNRRS
ncbi:MAG: glycosyltransferase family 39 protein [Chlamydiota bacterium]